MQQKLKDAKEGIDNSGRTYFLNTLISSFSNVQISEDDLTRYDLNIQEYVEKINRRRGNVSLKYFQYLSILFTEIFLDNIKNRKIEFIYNLNNYLDNYGDKKLKDIIGKYDDNDLKKLAYYMATGSGKTLIAHINYYQFFRYKLFTPDSIIFITPNEGLSKQHYEELQKSGIPARLYAGELNYRQLGNGNEVLVIEMTKFVEGKKGGGVTIPIDTFEGKNLIFVDEGHKGKKSEEQKWAKLRDKLAANGFVFEYSATFGQILSEKNKDTLREYAKSIIFDYSYRYFYLDGYGKDFFVANVEQKDISEDRFQDIMFVANLLSFYEQLLIYEDNQDIIREYNIEKPLWIFVGTTVVGKQKSNKLTDEENITISDVIQIIKYIEKTINDVGWLNSLINDILCGNTGIKNKEGKDVFSNKFEYLKKRIGNIDYLYEKVFNGKGKFCIYELKNAEGEFGLKISENHYFGVINIGDVSAFKNQIISHGFSVEQDVLSTSLFENIKKDNSPINILIGAKKFIEGWDTWRVSSMGLLNIGKEQGSQIIQLFGRGVRLKGKNMCLKRSEVNTPIRYLETLNIYSINADYLSKFLNAIRKEEVEFETIEIPIKLQHENKWAELFVLHKDEKRKLEEELLKLDYDNTIKFEIDLTPKISTYDARERREESGEVIGIESQRITPQIEELEYPFDKIDLLDWDKIKERLVEWKIIKNYFNLIIDYNNLYNLLKILFSNKTVKINAPKKTFDIKEKGDINRLEKITLLIIQKYIEKFYEKWARRYETKYLTYKTAEDNKSQLLLPFISENRNVYKIQIRRDETDLIEKIKQLTNDLNKLYNDKNGDLPRINMDEHLFIPILIKSIKIDKITPEGLVESERDFVIGLREFFRKNKKYFTDYEFFILRNFSKSGTGFQLKWSKFFPDFIIWIKDIKNKDNQIIIFIEPHGLEHSRGLNDEKIQFASSNDPDIITIKNIEKELNKNQSKNIRLEYFLLSVTEYDKLKKGLVNFPTKDEFEANNVLFLKDSDWPSKIFKKIGIQVN
jgi:hypothetical protein